MATQDNWRRCGKCDGLFWDGYPDKGRCPAGGGHVRIKDARNYNLAHSTRETPNAQSNWRFCHKCEGMFFDGYAAKGVCPAGGGHEAAGFVFVLPHDIAGMSGGPWRFCQQCFAMFFEGAADKGRCPVGGSHVAQGYVFALHFGGNID